MDWEAGTRTDLGYWGKSAARKEWAEVTTVLGLEIVLYLFQKKRVGSQLPLTHPSNPDSGQKKKLKELKFYFDFDKWITQDPFDKYKRVNLFFWSNY